MAQTTDMVSMSDGDIEVSADNSSWTNISGTAGSVEGTDQKRKTGEAYTLSGDGAVITTGKREPMELKIKVVYSEEDLEGYEIMRGYFEAGTRIYLRYSPKGIGATGRKVLTTSNAEGTPLACPISEFVYPEIDAESGDPIMSGFTLFVPALTTTETGSSTGLGS